MAPPVLVVFITNRIIGVELLFLFLALLHPRKIVLDLLDIDSALARFCSPISSKLDKLIVPHKINRLTTYFDTILAVYQLPVYISNTLC